MPPRQELSILGAFSFRMDSRTRVSEGTDARSSLWPTASDLCQELLTDPLVFTSTIRDMRTSRVSG